MGRWVCDITAGKRERKKQGTKQPVTSVRKPVWGNLKTGGKVCLLIHASGPLPEQEVLKSPFGPFARSKAPGEVHPRVVYVEALVHASLPSDGGLMPAVWWSNAT